MAITGEFTLNLYGNILRTHLLITLEKTTKMEGADYFYEHHRSAYAHPRIPSIT
jgi:hypothetical protein